MDDQRLRIVLFADVLEENFDGVSVTLHKILKNAPSDQFEFLVITSHPPKNIAAIPHRILITNYLKLPFQKGYRLGLPNKKVKREIDAFNPGLIHFTSPSFYARFAIKYGKKAGIPVMNIYHTHYPAYIRYYIGKIGNFLIGWLVNLFVMDNYKRAELTLVPTKPIKKDLMKLGVPKEKMRVWGRAIETKSYSESYRDEHLFDGSIPPGHKKVLFVSRLIREKNMTSIHHTYELIRKKRDDVSFVITGDGPMRDWLQKKMPDAHFTGKLIGEDLAKVYASCDVFFFPSFTETFGNVVIEALASGLPVVSADAGGPSELIRHGKNGYLVASGKSQDFASFLLDILSNDELRIEMRREALESINNRSIESLHQQLWQIYHSLYSPTV